VDELSEMNLADDVAEVREAKDATRWEIQYVAPDVVLVTMSPKDHPTDKFSSRWTWTVYPANPPSLKFQDDSTGRLDLTSAWPLFPGSRPTSFDTCVNWTAEGFGLHAEWKCDPNYRWMSDGNVLLKVLRYLQEKLDDEYQGRSA
jgi:hypothetical protein